VSERPFSATKEDISEIPALILAGGLGTRLRPAFDSGPKSMAPIAGRPFLEYLFLQISHAGFHKVTLCLGYGRDQIEEWAGDGAGWGLSIRYSVEPSPRGTAGAVKLAAELIDNDVFLVLNGDSFLAVDLRQLVKTHLQAGVCATIALASVGDPSRYGSVISTPEGRIEAFLEKSAAGSASVGCLINGGIYVFRRSVLDLIPEHKAASLEREIFPQLLVKGMKGFVSNGYFIDIGLPDDFKRAQSELPQCV